MKKKLLLVVAGIGLVVGVNGQTNIFPTTGNVGIFTASPQAKLHIDRINGAGIILSTNSAGTVANPLSRKIQWGNYLGNEAGSIDLLDMNQSTYGTSMVFTIKNDANVLQEALRINWFGNVGIGTASPTERLHIEGKLRIGGTQIWDNEINRYNNDNLYIGYRNTSNTILQANGGNVGIGTLNPYGKLSVFDSNRGIEFTPYIEGANGGVFEIIDRSDFSKRMDMNFYISNNGGNIKFYTSASEKVRITKDGNVLIGKTTQTNTTYKLDVAGKIRADEITVNTTGADFVFAPTYKLRTLAEVETFIKANKHLPDIAPAADMQTNGVSMGDMQAKLLQKVEELTLYVLQLEKRIEELESVKK